MRSFLSFAAVLRRCCNSVKSFLDQVLPPAAANTCAGRPLCIILLNMLEMMPTACMPAAQGLACMMLLGSAKSLLMRSSHQKLVSLARFSTNKMALAMQSCRCNPATAASFSKYNLTDASLQEVTFASAIGCSDVGKLHCLLQRK